MSDDDARLTAALAALGNPTGPIAALTGNDAAARFDDLADVVDRTIMRRRLDVGGSGGLALDVVGRRIIRLLPPVPVGWPPDLSPEVDLTPSMAPDLAAALRGILAAEGPWPLRYHPPGRDAAPPTAGVSAAALRAAASGTAEPALAWVRIAGGDIAGSGGDAALVGALVAAPPTPEADGTTLTIGTDGLALLEILEDGGLLRLVLPADAAYARLRG